MSKFYLKLANFGGEGGHEWDDDVYEGVRKVYVGQDSTRISYIKFEYVKEDGQVVTREYGTIDHHPKEFAVQYPDEYIYRVEGSYQRVALSATEVITSLVFLTSNGRKSPMFGLNVFGITSGTKFAIENRGSKIVGFHGRSDNALDALGAYFEQGTLNRRDPVYKLQAQGGTEGIEWDDGSHEGIKTLRISQDDCRITYLECEYDSGGTLRRCHHGRKQSAPSEFVLFPDEYIDSVEATYHKTDLFHHTVITSLKFVTSKGRTTCIYGYNTGKKFVLEQKGRRLVGLDGREGSAIDALGAYFAPVHTPTPTPLIPAKKLPAAGGNGGVSWDDGAYDGVKKILVGQGNDGVAFVNFEYNKGSQVIIGDGHGKQTLLGTETFELDYPSEYLTSVEGYYDKVFGAQAEVMTSLTFKTNKRKSQPFGLAGGEFFELKEEGHKIVGFHGKVSDLLHQFGAHVLPITN